MPANNSSAPGDFAGVAMAYDPSVGAIVAVDANFSFVNGTFTASNPALTWTYSAGNWTRLNLTTGPPPLGFWTMTYDTADQCLVLFGGEEILGGSTVNYTFTFANGTWTNLTPNLTVSPPPLQLSQMTYDAADGYVLLHGGFSPTLGTSGNYMVTWAFVNGTWANLTRPASPMPALNGWMTYDVSDRYVLYFGGSPGGGMTGSHTNDTWEFRNGSWTNLTAIVHNAPSPRDRAPIEYDSATGTVILCGGQRSAYPSNSSYLNDTWSYSALTWTELSPSSGFSPRENMVLAYDAADRQVVGFGGFGLVLNVNPNASQSYVENDFADTWSYSGGTWTPVAPVLTPARPIVDTGATFSLSVIGSADSPGARVIYVGLPGGCVSQNSYRLECRPNRAGTFRPAVEIETSLGDISWAFTEIIVNVGPSVASFRASSSIVRLGESMQVTAVVTNGTGALSIQHTGLPPGCQDQNSSALVCRPTSPGTFTIGIVVTDRVGGVATAETSVRVIDSDFVVHPPATSSRSPGLGPHLLHQGQPAPGWLTLQVGFLAGLTTLVAVLGWGVWRLQVRRQAGQLVAELEHGQSDGPDGAPGPPPP
ncbi:MAG: hypothetical protein L3K18_05005 [Thermoplasmata archaeon]|nr:hypothetical protein [Thermoplasmata archaeon]